MADPKEEHDIPADSAEEPNHDPQFEPIVSLPEQDVKTLEEDEEELFKMYVLYTFFFFKLGTIRLLMRRDKTLKICANHHIVPTMELKSNAGSDRAWVWNTLADYADESPKPELLAIRFLNAENAQKFKAKFDECKEEVRKQKGDTGEWKDPQFVPSFFPFFLTSDWLSRRTINPTLCYRTITFFLRSSCLYETTEWAAFDPWALCLTHNLK
uniref:Ran-specific GTPase-activating protein n=1 Tax=Cynoglossus semilaevis TaxID=244447 RepID=A0A3P8WWS9_CYNSE